MGETQIVGKLIHYNWYCGTAVCVFIFPRDSKAKWMKNFNLRTRTELKKKKKIPALGTAEGDNTPCIFVFLQTHPAANHVTATNRL